MSFPEKAGFCFEVSGKKDEICLWIQCQDAESRKVDGRGKQKIQLGLRGALGEPSAEKSSHWGWNGTPQTPDGTSPKDWGDWLLHHHPKKRPRTLSPKVWYDREETNEK